MANISREDDLKDFQERMANSGRRRTYCTDVRESREEAIKRTEEEVKNGLRRLRQMAKTERSQ